MRNSNHFIPLKFVTQGSILSRIYSDEKVVGCFIEVDDMLLYKISRTRNAHEK